MQANRDRSLSWEDPLEKEMAPCSNILAWKIPWAEEPDRLQSMELPRVRHNWMTEHTALSLESEYSYIWTLASLYTEAIYSWSKIFSHLISKELCRYSVLCISYFEQWSFFLQASPNSGCFPKELAFSVYDVDVTSISINRCNRQCEGAVVPVSTFGKNICAVWGKWVEKFLSFICSMETMFFRRIT